MRARRRAPVGLRVAVATAVLAACTGQGDEPRDQPQPSLTGGVTIQVSETEYRLGVEPRDGLVPATYTLVVDNQGSQPHALAVRGPGTDDRTRLLRPGTDPVELAVRLRPGRYVLWCPVAGHRDRGMETVVVVDAL